MSKFKVRINMVVHAEHKEHAEALVDSIMQAANHVTREDAPKLNDAWEHYGIKKVTPCPN